MKIGLLLENGTLDGVLDDTAVAADFAALLPLELLLSDFAYYAPWETLRCSTRLRLTRTPW